LAGFAADISLCCRCPSPRASANRAVLQESEIVLDISPPLLKQLGEVQEKADLDGQALFEHPGHASAGLERKNRAILNKNHYEGGDGKK
jgi:hypothetical protein